MNLAEFFIKVGTKGDGDTKKNMLSLSGTIKEVRSSSLAAKAAILGVLYGIERFTGAAGEKGNNLLNFAAATDVSAQSLQKWQYALGQVGVKGEEVTGTISAIQKAIQNMQLGKGAPEGFQQFVQSVGVDLNKVNDIPYLLSKAQEFAKKSGPILRKRFVEGLGVGENLFGALVRNPTLNPEGLRGVALSDKQLEGLSRFDAARYRLGYKVALESEKLLSAYGPKVAVGMERALDRIIVKAHTLAKAFSEWVQGGGLDRFITRMEILADKLERVFGPIARLLSAQTPGAEPNTRVDTPLEAKFREMIYKVLPPPTSNAPTYGPPSSARGPASVTVNQTFENNGEDPRVVQDAAKKGIREAYRGMPAQLDYA